MGGQYGPEYAVDGYRDKVSIKWLFLLAVINRTEAFLLLALFCFKVRV